MYRLSKLFLPGTPHHISDKLPGMLKKGNVSIVNIASVASSIKGIPNRFCYATSKAATIGLTKAIAADFVAKGIRYSLEPVVN